MKRYCRCCNTVFILLWWWQRKVVVIFQTFWALDKSPLLWYELENNNMLRVTQDIWQCHFWDDHQLSVIVIQQHLLYHHTALLAAQCLQINCIKIWTCSSSNIYFNRMWQNVKIVTFTIYVLTDNSLWRHSSPAQITKIFDSWDNLLHLQELICELIWSKYIFEEVEK